jgi:hypothetical protein
MSTTTTTIQNDDIMTLSYAEIINETVPHNPELQLSIQDLVNPTETAESLLETLSNEQLSIIEQAVNKIKERKLGNASTKDINNQGNIEMDPFILLHLSLTKKVPQPPLKLQ